MRIVLDLQACQTDPERKGKYAFDFSEALLRQAGKQAEIWIVLNGDIADTVEPIRAAFEGKIPQSRIVVWQPGTSSARTHGDTLESRVAEQVREAFLSSLKPDVIYVSDCFSPCAVASVGEFDARIPTAVAIDADVMTSVADPESDRPLRNLRCRRQTHFKRAQLWMAASQTLRDEAVKLFDLPEDSVLMIPPGETGAQCALAAFEKLTAMHPKDRADLQSISSKLRAKPKLAYLSPLPPLTTGIATYSAELLPALARYYEIEVVVDQTEVSDPWIQAHFPIRDWRWFNENAGNYERILYHMGNSPAHRYIFDLLERHPGTVVLHDFFLGHGLDYFEWIDKNATVWTNALYASHGYQALIERASNPNSIVGKYPGCWQVLSRAEGVIVHSEHSRQLVQEWFPNANALQWARIPHLRAPRNKTPDQGALRQALKLDPNDFVVCSFGHIGENKMSDIILQAWLKSPLANNHHCKLVFVGQLADNAWGKDLNKAIESSGAASRIRITGYVNDAQFADYLAAADVGVQLRQHSRGETSGTVIDCMNYGLALIVNAHGSFAELPDDCLIKLADRFDPQDLTNALSSLQHNTVTRRALGKRAQDYVSQFLSPKKIAAQYRDAIEGFYSESWQGNERRLLRAVLRLGSVFEKGKFPWLKFSASVVQNRKDSLQPERQLLIDVTVVAVEDLRTGVQRVVRSYLSELLHNPPQGYRPEPVYRDRRGVYRYARQFTQEFLGCNRPNLEDAPISDHPDDIFFGLDLHPNSVWKHRDEFKKMRDRGVRIIFLLHDILPVLRPIFFPPNQFLPFQRWLETIAHVSHGIICVSHAVADELLEWLETAGINRVSPLNIGVCHHGADIAASAPTRGVKAGFPEKLQVIATHRTFLTVGTVEPRKGHVQTLAAFDLLWSRGQDVILSIVGKKGWLMDDFAEHVRHHREFNKRLFWFEGISDEMLTALYEGSSALLMPSEGEGFGLPLIEAAMHALPIIARDLPVFREVSGSHAFYFTGLAPENLAQALREWLARFEKGSVPLPDNHPRQTWKEAAIRLKATLIDDQWYKQKRWNSSIEAEKPVTSLPSKAL